MLCRQFTTSAARAATKKNNLFNALFKQKRPRPRIPQTEDEIMAPLPPTTAKAAFSGTPPRPANKRPPKMVEVTRKQGLRGLLSSIFKTDQSSHRTAQRFRQEKLSNIGLNQVKFLNTDSITNILYWYTVDMKFNQSDFQRLLPDKNLRVGSYDPQFDTIDIEVHRARNPVNLTRWMGYFLTFKSKDAAMVYYQETLGAELCGMPLKLRFVEPSIRGYTSPLLDKAPGVSRHSHALILGLPVGYSETTILRVLWDYDLIDDDKLAVQRVPVDRVKYGGSPFVLRFKSEEEADRFVKDYNQQIFPYTSSRVLCEVVD